jgi:hypothetical protein
MPQVLQVHANLMSPAREQSTKHKRIVVYLLQHLQNRMRAPAPLDNRHFLSMYWVPADRSGYLTLLLRELPVAEG